MSAILSRADLERVGERKLRLGVAGLGRAFTVMLPTFTGDPRVALVAAADPRAEARQRFAADFAAKAYATVEELCADPVVEVVYVATPHQYHAQHAVLAARHGKHLLVEKPMALTLEECAAMIDAARQRRRASRRRSQPFVRCADRAPARVDRERRIRRRAHDQRDQLHRLSLSPAPPGRTRHRAGRRRGVQSGGASGRYRAAARRRAGDERARRDRRLGSRAADRRRLCGAADLRERRFRVADL